MSTITLELIETRFGRVEFTHDDVVCFEEGLVGFPRLKSFVLLMHKPGSQFRWLQSVEEPAIAFLVVDPAYYVADYAPSISDKEAERLDLSDETPRLLLTTVSIPGGNPDEMTLNLAGPILINAASRVGKQLVLEGDAYTIKHRVFQKVERASNLKAA